MAFRLPRLQLHNKILLALVLGAAFGALFNVSKYEIAITTRLNGERVTEEVAHWSSVEFIGADGKAFASFGPEDQLRILPAFNRLKPEEKRTTAVRVVSDAPDAAGNAARTEQKFEQVVSIEKVKTIAVMIKPIGTIFIRLLMFVAIPLVISSLIVGAASLGDIRKVGRIGAKTLAFYAITIVSAITIGLILVNVIQPGTRLAPEAREKLITEFQGSGTAAMTSEAELNLTDMLIRIVATNPIEAMARGDMLQIVFFALMVGVSLTAGPGYAAVRP